MHTEEAAHTHTHTHTPALSKLTNSRFVPEEIANTHLARFITIFSYEASQHYTHTHTQEATHTHTHTHTGITTPPHAFYLRK